LYTGTDSSRSPSTELEPAPKDSKAFVTKRPENSPETPIIALEKMRREEDNHSEATSKKNREGYKRKKLFYRTCWTAWNDHLSIYRPRLWQIFY
jgi:hypothetical protein